MVLAVTIVLLGAVSYAAVLRENRGICKDTWSNVPDPCVHNPNKTIYFPHPADVRKFIQCDLLGRMYIIQCPRGEKYDFTTSSCAGNASTPTGTTPQLATTTIQVTNSQTPGQTTSQTPKQTTSPTPALTNPPTPAPTNRPTTAQVTTQPTTARVTTSPTPAQRTTSAASATLSKNPCTNANFAHGLNYFEHPTDRNKFIECDLTGNAIVMSCDPGLVWLQKNVTCAFNMQQAGFKIPTGAPVQTTLTTTVAPKITTPAQNPCTPDAISHNKLFHPHPDPHKFYQCDMAGNVQTYDCPPTLVWNSVANTCTASYLNLPAVG
ncbi:mucin-2-like [Mytilus trossulus]|uniref:mucin-2-like n=1 Tax=Mytilus trossulus TaxID=6551 RepID=UPI003007597E